MTPMPQPPKPWTARLRDRTQAGPIRYDQAIAEMMALIPPGRAYRHGLAQYQRWHGNAAADLPREKIIKSGARYMAQTAVSHAKSQGTVEVYKVDGVKWIKTGPVPWFDFQQSNKTGNYRGREISAPQSAFIKATVLQGPVELDALLRRTAEQVPDDQAARWGVVAAIRNPKSYKNLVGDALVRCRANQHRRRLAHSAFTNFKRSKRIVVVEEDGKKIVKLGPNPWPS